MAQCGVCNGTGICRFCNGTGDDSIYNPLTTPNNVFSGGGSRCIQCFGNGKCIVCNGSGEV